MNSRHRIQISASILSADFSRLGEQIAEAEAAGVDSIHIDVMDGRFVPNITVGPLVVAAVRRITRLPLPTHLMIVEPERYIDEFAAAGADSILVHQETCPHLHRTIQQIKARGIKAGVVLNPATPTILIEEVLNDLDSILVMTVNPGFGGQSFIPNMLAKIRRVRQLLEEKDSHAELAVDGGINLNTIPSVVASGATVLAMGSALFSASGGLSQAVAEVRRSIESLPEVFNK